MKHLPVMQKTMFAFFVSACMCMGQNIIAADAAEAPDKANEIALAKPGSSSRRNGSGVSKAVKSRRGNIVSEQPVRDIATVKALAEKAVGGGVMTEYELESERGLLYHHVTMEKDGYEYEVTVRDSDGSAYKSGLDLED